MKITTYILAIFILSISSAKSKSVTETGNIEIDDLFFDSNPIGIQNEKNPFQKNRPILIQDDELELESLQIDDIDIATFGEYEDFLNKYYDENFLDINSRFIRQFEFDFSTSFGRRIPFGENAKLAFGSGIDFGITLSPTSTFKIFNLDSKLYSNLNLTFITPKNINFSNLQIIRISGGITTYLYKNIFLNSGLNITSSKGGTPDNPTANYGGAVNVDLGYKFNIVKTFNIGIYARAQMMPFGSADPPFDGGGSVETLSFGLLLGSPVYLIY